MDNAKKPYMTMLAVTWALCAAGLLFAAPVLMMRVTEREWRVGRRLLRRLFSHLFSLQTTSDTEPEQEKTAPGREETVKEAAEAASAHLDVMDKTTA